MIVRILRKIAIRGVIYYLLGSLAFGVFLAEVRIHPPRRTLGPTPQGMEDVSISTGDGLTLRAWFGAPGNVLQPNGDAVILLHGVADNREGVGDYAELFRSHGYAVLTPDARAHGTSDGFASYGVREAGDVHAWTDWLVARVHPRCVYGFGESMGAAIILQAVSVEPRLCGVVAESPFSTFRAAAYDQTARFLNAGPWLGATFFRPSIEIGLWYARIRYGLALADASPLEAVAKSRVPVLLIHGLADSHLQPDHSRRIRESRKDVDLWEVPRAEHCGARSVDQDEFDRRVLTFLKTFRYSKPIAQKTKSANMG